eukprot:6428996-Pyramimonas_sp.AAC.1
MLGRLAGSPIKSMFAVCKFVRSKAAATLCSAQCQSNFMLQYERGTRHIWLEIRLFPSVPLD